MTNKSSDIISLKKIKRKFNQRFIVCPKPYLWARMYDIFFRPYTLKLKVKEPLILAAWGNSEKKKFERFMYHLKIAQELGILSKVDNFLNSYDISDFLQQKNKGTLDEIGYFDLLREDLIKVEKQIFKAKKSLKKIQSINQKVTDEDILYKLFIKNGFSVIEEENKLKIKKGKSQLIDLLLEIIDIFETQKSLREGDEELEDFCCSLFRS